MSAEEWEVIPPPDALTKRAPFAEADAAIWERRDDEGHREYAAFQQFLALGKGRSLWRFVREEAPIEGLSMQAAHAEWSALHAAFDWDRRAAAYDEYLAGRQLAKYEEDRDRLRGERMQMLQAYLRVLAQQIKKMGENSRFQADMGEVTAALKMVMEQLRTEYMDTPRDRLAEKGQGGQGVIHAVDIQRILVRYREYEEGQE